MMTTKDDELTKTPQVTRNEMVEMRTDSGLRGDAIDEGDDDDDEENVETFTHIEALADHGANQSDINKLLSFGYANCRLVMSASKRELAEVPGISEERADVLKKKAKQADSRAAISFSTALELAQIPRKTITTGSASLDRLLGGGVELNTITSVYGESATGKTQLCLTLCVRAQMASAEGGAEGRALFIDCNQTFRAERIVQIAAAAELGPEQTLANITYVQVSSFDEQNEVLTKASSVLADASSGEYRLLIIDGLMTHLRAEYAGRGELSARQQALNAHMRKLKLLADAFNLAVLVTNQVSAIPDSFAAAGPTTKPIGGPVLAHNISTKLSMRKARGSTKKIIVEQSPHMPKEDCLISITAAGVVDAIDD